MASAGRNRRRHRQRWCGLLLLLLLHHTDGLGWMCLRAPEPEAVAGMVERPNLPNPRDLAMKLGPAALRHHPHSPVPRRRKPHINPLACLGLVHTVWPRRLRRVPEDAGRSAGAVRPLRGLRTRKECGSASAGGAAGAAHPRLPGRPAETLLFGPKEPRLPGRPPRPCAALPSDFFGETNELSPFAFILAASFGERAESGRRFRADGLPSGFGFEDGDTGPAEAARSLRRLNEGESDMSARLPPRPILPPAAAPFSLSAAEGPRRPNRAAE